MCVGIKSSYVFVAADKHQRDHSEASLSGGSSNSLALVTAGENYLQRERERRREGREGAREGDKRLKC